MDDRLWHYKLIPILPDAILIGQWTTCQRVADIWARFHEEKITREPLIRPLLNHTIEDFIIYCNLVRCEMVRREYYIEEYSEVLMKDNFFKIGASRVDIDNLWNDDQKVDEVLEIFSKWHNDEYLTICYYSLEERYLCGCISEWDWAVFLEGGLKYV